MAYDDFQPGDIFSIQFRTEGQMEGCWYGLGEAKTLEEGETLFEAQIEADRNKGAGTGARWRLTHERGCEIIRVLEDLTLRNESLHQQ